MVGLLSDQLYHSMAHPCRGVDYRHGAGRTPHSPPRNASPHRNVLFRTYSLESGLASSERVQGTIPHIFYPKGSVMPTALYVFIEDIVAVDGGGGQKYRRALRDRYLASPYFRQMLFEMNCFWAGGAIVWATVITIIIFTTPRDVAYTVGWTVPFLWAGLWTLITIPWVQADLRREKEAWARNSVQGNHPFTDDISGPILITRLLSVTGHLTSKFSFRSSKFPSARPKSSDQGAKEAV